MADVRDIVDKFLTKDGAGDKKDKSKKEYKKKRRKESHHHHHKKHHSNHHRDRKKSKNRRPEQKRHKKTHHTHQGNTPSKPAKTSASTSSTVGKGVADFLVTLKHKTKLPGPPLDPMLLKYPHPQDHLTRFCAANLEFLHEWELLPESGLAIPIDMIDPTTYELDEGCKTAHYERRMAKEDLEILHLLEERITTMGASIDKERIYNVKNSFLPETQFYVPRLRVDKRRAVNTQREDETKYAFEQRRKEELMEDDEEESDNLDVKTMQKTFESIQLVDDFENFRHPEPKKAHLRIVAADPVFPDDRLLHTEYCHVKFDSPPSRLIYKVPALRDKVAADPSFAERCADASLLRRSMQKGIETSQPQAYWISQYGLSEEVNELDQKYEWVSEWAPRTAHLTNETDGGYFFAQTGDEIVYARVSSRLDLLHREIGDSSNKEVQRKFRKLPKQIHLSLVEEAEDDM